MSKEVLLLLAEGFEEIEAVTSIDILRRAGVEVKVACVGAGKIVRGSRNIEIKADVDLEKISVLPDAVVLPGGTRGAENLASSEKVVELIKKVCDNKKIVAAICAAPALVLAPLGILNGKRVTSSPAFKSNFGQNISYVDEPVVVDGNIITAQGPAAALMFALKIVEALEGTETVEEIKEAIVMA